MGRIKEVLGSMFGGRTSPSVVRLPGEKLGLSCAELKVAQVHAGDMVDQDGAQSDANTVETDGYRIIPGGVDRGHRLTDESGRFYAVPATRLDEVNGELTLPAHKGIDLALGGPAASLALGESSCVVVPGEDIYIRAKDYVRGGPDIGCIHIGSDGRGFKAEEKVIEREIPHTDLLTPVNLDKLFGDAGRVRLIINGPFTAEEQKLMRVGEQLVVVGGVDMGQINPPFSILLTRMPDGRMGMEVERGPVPDVPVEYLPDEEDDSSPAGWRGGRYAKPSESVKVPPEYVSYLPARAVILDPEHPVNSRHELAGDGKGGRCSVLLPDPKKGGKPVQVQITAREGIDSRGIFTLELGPEGLRIAEFVQHDLKNWFSSVRGQRGVFSAGFNYLKDWAALEAERLRKEYEAASKSTPGYTAGMSPEDQRRAELEAKREMGQKLLAVLGKNLDSPSP